MNVELLKKRRDAEIEAAEAVLKKVDSEGRTWTPEEEKECKAHTDEAERLSGMIAQAEKLPARQTRAADPPSGLESAARVEVRDRAEDRPWSNTGEFLLAVRDTCGPSQRFDPRLKTRTITEDGFAVPRVQYMLQSPLPNESAADYMRRVQTRAATGLGETTLSEGGFLVMQDMSMELIRRVYDTALVIGRCRRFPLGPTSNGVKIPYVDETSRATGSRWGGVRAYWADEAEEKTSSKPKFGQLALDLKKLVALCYATDELLQDATVLGAFIEQAFTEEMAFAVDDVIINGTGAGQPLGILNCNALVSVAKETSQAAATIKYANAVKMYARLWSRSFANAVWFINQDVIPQLTQMTVDVKNVAGSENVGGSAAYMPPGGLSNLPYGVLLSRPVVPIEQCKTIGTVGDIILADLSQYLVIAKGLQVASSIHVRFIYDESCFRFVYRIDGQPSWKQALTPYQGTNTQSPFIALATRA